MLFEHFFRFFEFRNKYIPYTIVVDVNPLMPRFVLAVRSIHVNS